MQRREALLLGEMIDAAEQAHLLAAGRDLDAIETDRLRRDALPNFVAQLRAVLEQLES